MSSLPRTWRRLPSPGGTSPRRVRRLHPRGHPPPEKAPLGEDNTPHGPSPRGTAPLARRTPSFPGHRTSERASSPLLATPSLPRDVLLPGDTPSRGDTLPPRGQLPHEDTTSPPSKAPGDAPQPRGTLSLQEDVTPPFLTKRTSHLRPRGGIVPSHGITSLGTPHRSRGPSPPRGWGREAGVRSQGLRCGARG